MLELELRTVISPLTLSGGELTTTYSCPYVVTMAHTYTFVQTC